jgi:hypothetical protein
VTVELEDGIGLAVREKVGYELPLDFAEGPVTEIQVDGTEFDPAPPGAHVGLKTSPPSRRLGNARGSTASDLGADPDGPLPNQRPLASLSTGLCRSSTWLR